MRPIILARSKTNFPRGLGVEVQPPPPWWSFPANGGSPISNWDPTHIVRIKPVTPPSSNPGTSPPGQTYYPMGGGSWKGWGQFGEGSGISDPYAMQSGGGYQYGQASTIPTQATSTAFTNALAAAGAAGVISPSQVSTLQAQAADPSMTDAQLQSLTAQIQALMSTNPSVASTSALATIPTASPSWWDGSTTLAGYTVKNTMLVGGAAALAVGYYLFVRKKK